MKIEEKHNVRLIKTIPVFAEVGFSIDSFKREHGDKLGSISNGMEDNMFALEEDFSGTTVLNLFQCNKTVDTQQFLSDAVAMHYFVTGVKGLALLFLQNKSQLPEEWILSPCKLHYSKKAFEDNIPYLGTLKNRKRCLHHSTHSVGEISKNHYILLGRHPIEISC